MDSTCDSYENYRFAVEDIGAVPVIVLNPRGEVDAVGENILPSPRAKLSLDRLYPWRERAMAGEIQCPHQHREGLL